MLLDEAHELAVRTRFRDMDLNFNGNMDMCGFDDIRGRYPGKDGRAPPLRGIIKELGTEDAKENLSAPLLHKILRDMKKLQQLGIIRIDVAARQIIDEKISDFSTATTTPHYMMTPELNPHLTPEMISLIEREAFIKARYDYEQFNYMVRDWNWDHEGQKRSISVRSFLNMNLTVNLRSKTAKERFYTFIDPRKYDWRRSGSPGGSEKIRRKLSARPPMWYYDCDSEAAARIGATNALRPPLDWYYKEGFMYPGELREEIDPRDVGLTILRRQSDFKFPN